MEVVNNVPETDNNQEAEKTAEDYFGYEPEIFDSIKEKLPEEDTEGEVSASTDPTELINKTLKEIKVDDKGKFIYPDEIDPTLKAAVAATKSFRDTQAAYTKSQQKLKEMEAELEVLRNQVTTNIDPTSLLTPEEKKELDQLKYQNPEKWRGVMQILENKAREQVNQNLSSTRQVAGKQAAIEQRMKILEEFNKGLDTPLTPEQLDMEVPPAWAQQVLEGKMDFVDYLEKAAKFLGSTKTIERTPAPEKTTNMNQTTGSSTPVVDKEPEGIDYSTVTF